MAGRGQQRAHIQLTASSRPLLSLLSLLSLLAPSRPLFLPAPACRPSHASPKSPKPDGDAKTSQPRRPSSPTSKPAPPARWLRPLPQTPASCECTRYLISHTDEGGFWDHNTCNERRENRWIGASIVNIHGTRRQGMIRTGYCTTKWRHSFQGVSGLDSPHPFIARLITPVSSRRARASSRLVLHNSSSDAFQPWRKSFDRPMSTVTVNL
jgi:hypothetical protein